MITILLSLFVSGWIVFWLYPRLVLLYALSKGITAMSKIKLEK
jgi:hypothetical protein